MVATRTIAIEALFAEPRKRDGKTLAMLQVFVASLQPRCALESLQLPSAVD